MISSASSVLRPRVVGSRCMASHSGPRGLPMPKPGSMRPSDSTSMVAHCLASSTGSRITAATTLTPNLIRRVRPATAASPVMHSRIGVRLTRRSLCQIESTPPSSHRSTQRQNPDAVRNGYSIRPMPAATVRGMSSMHSHVLVHAGRLRQADVDVAGRVYAHAVHGSGFPAGEHRAVAVSYADRVLALGGRLLGQVEVAAGIPGHVVRTAHARPHADVAAVGREILDSGV